MREKLERSDERHVTCLDSEEFGRRLLEQCEKEPEGESGYYGFDPRQRRVYQASCPEDGRFVVYAPQRDCDRVRREPEVRASSTVRCLPEEEFKRKVRRDCETEPSLTENSHVYVDPRSGEVHRVTCPGGSTR